MSTTNLEVAPAGEGEKPLRQGYDLLQLRPIKALVRWKGFPYVFQAGLLAFLLFLAVFAWNLYPPEAVPGKLYAKSNLVTLLIWGLWWPAMVWVVVLFGRVWCAVCPLELVANGTERLARLLRVRQQVLSKWLQAGWLILALYGLLLMLVSGVQLHRHPAYTAVFLWSMFAAAVLVGFLFKDRAFCRGFCPVGLLLGTYGRGSMLAVRPVSSHRCDQCAGKDCTLASNRTRLDGRSCPSLLNPARLNDNADCLVCGQCVKACRPDNLGLFLRRPFHPADARESLASWPVVLFVMLVSGFVTAELFTEWKAAQAYYLWVPQHVATWLGAEAQAGWVEGVWTLGIVPLALWSILGAMVVLLRGAKSLAEAWRRLALPLAVVIAASQMSKGLAKFVSWVGFLPLAAKDPVGVETGRALAAEAMPQPASILPLAAVSVVAMLLVLAAAYFAVREVRLAQGENARGYRAPVLAAAACALLMVFGWGFLQ